jgi:hypothetical protein
MAIHSLEAFCSERSFKALFDETINVLQPISDRPSILFRHGNALRTPLSVFFRHAGN